jgi:hypothetical protein
MDIGSIIAIIISVLGIAATYFGFVMKSAERQNSFENRISERIAKVESDNDTFWKVIGPHMATIIHSPEHKDRDQLVDKLIEGRITQEEAERLTCLLELNILENHNEGKKLASALLLARTKTILKAKGK